MTLMTKHRHTDIKTDTNNMTDPLRHYTDTHTHTHTANTHTHTTQMPEATICAIQVT